jgi:acyl-coenzyme A thioesterase PaaI-like protein
MGASAVTFARRATTDVTARITVANVEMKTSFYRPVRIGSVLVCVATVASGTERVVFCEAEVSDDADHLVGKATSTYVIGRRD